MQDICQRKGIGKALHSSKSTPIIAAMLIILSLHPYPHFFGRFQQAFVQTPEKARLVGLANTAQWLHDNHAVEKTKFILSDTVTTYVVGAHLGSDHFKSFFHGRHSLENLENRIYSLGGAEGILTHHEIGGILALARQPEVGPVGSLLGRASGHWHPNIVNENFRFIPSIERELQPLIDNGWKKYSVPPYYDFYARPQKVQ